MRIVIIILAAIILSTTAASARRHTGYAEYDYYQWRQPTFLPDEWQPQRRQVRRHHHRDGSTKRRASNCRGDCKRPPSSKALITVSTAAGISITVNPSFAPKIQAFISDLVATGYTPKAIHCAASHGHVHGSRHYSGAACDIDQTGWGKTAPKMYHVADLAKKHGLRDGGSFRDWGHIDDGQALSRTRYANRNRSNVTRVALRPRNVQYATAAWNRP